MQFKLRGADLEPQTPSWLKDFLQWLGDVLAPVGRALRWLFNLFPDAPYARIFLWFVLALALAGMAALLVERMRSGEWRLPRLRKQTDYVPAEEEEWVPDERMARSWLEEADALAAQRRYSEAVHHLLFRSLEDIRRRRPQFLKPALTSREISAAATMPAAARSLFAEIARTVERSLFGGVPLGEQDWLSARSSYDDFALARSWHS